MQRMKDEGANTKDRSDKKLFVGGLDNRTTDESMKTFFEQWGQVIDLIVMKDPQTKKSRGFGFVTYSELEMVDRAMANRPHRIDGREVETKRAIPRTKDSPPENNISTKKIFIGGIKGEITEQDLRDYFSGYGNIVGVSLPIDKVKNRLRGFAFVEFDDYDAVDKIILRGPHSFNNRQADVKKAVKKEELASAVAKRAGSSANNDANKNSSSGSANMQGGGMMSPWMNNNRMGTAPVWPGQQQPNWGCGPMGWQQNQAMCGYGPQGSGFGMMPGFNQQGMSGFGPMTPGFGGGPMGFNGQMSGPMNGTGGGYGNQTTGMPPNFSMAPGFNMNAGFPAGGMPNAGGQQGSWGNMQQFPGMAGMGMNSTMTGYNNNNNSSNGNSTTGNSAGGGPMRAMTQSQTSRSAPYNTAQRSSTNNYSNGNYNRF